MLCDRFASQSDANPEQSVGVGFTIHRKPDFEWESSPKQLKVTLCTICSQWGIPWVVDGCSQATTH